MLLNDIDSHAFGNLIEKHRRELHVHSYRLMGSIHDAEDMVQETFLKAWNKRHTYEGRASLRAWLLKICTNVCLDALKKRPKRYVPLTRETVSTVSQPIPAEIKEPIWLEPFPDDLYPSEAHLPEESVLVREKITLAFITTLHLLPARQRAILVLCDVLEWQANEVATFMNTTVAAVKSALHRARTTLSAHGYTPDVEMRWAMDEATQTQLNNYVEAWETADIETFIQLLKDDATFSMPPIPSWYQGKASIRALVSMTIFRGEAKGRWRLLPTKANHQPAFGLYRQTDVADVYSFYGIQVITLRDQQIADIITFRNPQLAHYFSLPITLKLNKLV